MDFGLVQGSGKIGYKNKGGGEIGKGCRSREIRGIRIRIEWIKVLKGRKRA